MCRRFVLLRATRADMTCRTLTHDANLGSHIHFTVAERGYAVMIEPLAWIEISPDCDHSVPVRNGGWSLRATVWPTPLAFRVDPDSQFKCHANCAWNLQSARQTIHLHRDCSWAEVTDDWEVNDEHFLNPCG